jgi:biotin carboxylase
VGRSILVVYRPGGRYVRQLRGVLSTASELGVRPVVLSATPAREDAGLAETAGVQLHYCNLDDVAAVRRTVAGICREDDIERIFPLFEGDVYPASLCRKDNGVSGLQPDQAIAFRDKNVMHRRAAEIGVKVARSCQPYTLGAVEDFVAEVGLPIVVKPYAGWACGGTYRVDSAGDLARVWAAIRDDRHDYRVEEFIQGEQFHVDSLVQRGTVVFEMLSQYTYSILDFRDEPGGTVSRRHELSEPHREILAENARVLCGFGLQTGVAHVEFFLGPDGTVRLGEAAARAGGGSIVPAFEVGLGLNLAAEWCRIELSDRYRPSVVDGPEIGTEYLSTVNHGTITSITGADELMALESVLDAEVWASVGDVIAPPSASNDVLGYYVCHGTGFDDVRTKFQRIRGAFRVETRDG